MCYAVPGEAQRRQTRRWASLRGNPSFANSPSGWPLTGYSPQRPNQEPNSSFVKWEYGTSFQFSSVAQSCPTVCDPMGCSTLGLHVHHQLPEFTQTNVHWVSDTIQPSHPLSSPSPPALSLSQHQGLFKWVSSLHLVVKVSEFQLQHQSFQWIFKTDFL